MTFLTQRLGEEILVSFDVVSLFTKVPIELAIHVAKERLQEDNILEDRTALSINEIIQLLEFCLKATYFLFRGKYYQQIFGTAMGSSVFVVVADMVMENIEQRALNSFSHPPIFWKRYVDDTCVTLLPSLVDSFHQHLNSIEPSIQFMVEIENNGCLLFWTSSSQEIVMGHYSPQFIENRPTLTSISSSRFTTLLPTNYSLVTPYSPEPIHTHPSLYNR